MLEQPCSSSNQSLSSKKNGNIDALGKVQRASDRQQATADGEKHEWPTPNRRSAQATATSSGKLSEPAVTTRDGDRESLSSCDILSQVDQVEPVKLSYSEIEILTEIRSLNVSL